MANNLKKLREEKNLTLRDVEKFVGIDHSFLLKMEQGKRSISPENLAILSDFYNVSYAYLLNKTEEELKELNIPKTKIHLLLRNAEFTSAIQKECFVLLNYVLEENNLEIIKETIVSILKRENLKHHNFNLEEIKTKYLLEDSTGNTNNKNE